MPRPTRLSAIAPLLAAAALLAGGPDPSAVAAPVRAAAAPKTNGPLAELPFTRIGGHLVLYAALNDAAAPVPFLLDTGASTSLLTRAAADAHGLRTRDMAVRIFGVRVRVDAEAEGVGGKSVPIKSAEGVTLRLRDAAGGAFVPNKQNFAVTAIDLGTANGGAPYAGLLGQNLLKRYVVQIDHAAGRVRLFDPERFDPTDAGTAVPLRYRDGLPTVTAAIETAAGGVVEGDWDIDTGAGAALHVNAPFTDRHGLLAATPVTVPGKGVGVGGATEFRAGRLRAVLLGGYRLEGPVAHFSRARSGALADKKGAGLIGGELLRRFTVTLDPKRGRLYLKPGADLSAPFPAPRYVGWTFAPAAEGGWRVSAVADASPAASGGLTVGDVLLSVGGKPVAGLDKTALGALLTASAAEEVIGCEVHRGGEPRTLTVRPLVL